MLRPVTKIRWLLNDEAIPAFIAMVTIPFIYSIAQNIIWGFLSRTIVKLFAGKRDEASWTLLIIDQDYAEIDIIHKKLSLSRYRKT
jgi:adenine/guanine/hypoxanthine permease